MRLAWNETLKSLLLILILILTSTLLINILYYFDVISSNATKYLKMFFLILSFLLGGIYMGKNSPNKGYLYGLRLSFIIIIFFMFFGIIFNNLEFKRIIYYLITLCTTTFGSMIGINRKSN